MSSIAWLAPGDGPEALPPASQALRDPNGLLAAGGSLEPDWLLKAYEHGVFPWYDHGQPILWWCPNPRAVLWPAELKLSRSLRRKRGKRPFEITADRACAEVIAACAAPRRYARETWITAEMAKAYLRLHDLGWAHSFEAWQDAQLVGGLYGVAIGRVFFGESMFAKASDASKIAFVTAVEYLRESGFTLIDCQIPSAHLTRFGARGLPREAFLQHLREYCRPRGRPGSWSEPFERYQAL